MTDVQQQMRLGEFIREVERHARDALTDAVLDLLGALPDRAVLFIDLVAHKMYLDLLIQNLDHVDHLDHLGHAQLPPRFDTVSFPWYTL